MAVHYNTDKDTDTIARLCCAVYTHHTDTHFPAFNRASLPSKTGPPHPHCYWQRKLHFRHKNTYSTVVKLTVKKGDVHALLMNMDTELSEERALICHMVYTLREVQRK